jgi:hypothetical protein
MSDASYSLQVMVTESTFANNRNLRTAGFSVVELPNEQEFGIYSNTTDMLKYKGKWSKGRR